MKVCFVGAGSIGKRHIRNLKTLSDEEGFPLEIHLLRSSKKNLDKDISQIVTKEWYSISDISEKYDAIFITNPTYLHYEVMLGLKDYASFFFVEKPVFNDCNLDVSPFDEKGIYYVACPLRYTKVLQRAREITDDSRVLSVRSISSSYLPEWRPGIDYRDTYSAHKDQGGGVKIDLIHEWDYLTYLFGFPMSVKQLYGKYSDLEIDSEDLAVYIAQYKDKLIELHLDYFGRKTRRNCEIITTEDVYDIDITNSRIMKNGDLYEQYKEMPNDKYLEEMRYFIKLMNKETENTNDIRHAVRVMSIACDE